MRHQYYEEKIEKILEDQNYDELMELTIAPKIFISYMFSIATNVSYNLAVKNHILNLMNDAIQEARGAVDVDFDYNYRNFRSGALDDDLLKIKTFDIVQKEDAFNLSSEIMNKIMPEFMHLVGADDFINDIDKREILEMIEDVLIMENNRLF